MPEEPPIASDIERIAIICPSWVGDTVMATPVLRAVREARPTARIIAACRPGIDDLLAGAVVVVLSVLIMKELTGREGKCLLNPVRLFWLVVYTGFLAYYVVKANLDVAYRVLHPKLLIRPGIVKVKTSLRSAAAITALSNSITLTPGTLSVDIDRDNGILYVHWINVRAKDVETATKDIVERFEKILSKIFD